MQYAKIYKRIIGGILDYLLMFGVFWAFGFFYALFLAPDYSGAEIFIVMGILIYPHAMFVQLLSEPLAIKFGYYMLYVSLFFIEVLYYTLMTVLPTRGSLGHQAINASICYWHGAKQRPSIFTIFLRSCIKALSRYLFLLPFLTIFFTKQKQTLHDIVAGTVVIDKPPIDE